MIFFLLIFFNLATAFSSLINKSNVYGNLSAPELIEFAIKKGEGRLSQTGAFVVKTNRTGRSQKDKFIVKEPSSETKIFWSDRNKPISQENYEKLKFEILNYLDQQENIFVQDLQCGQEVENSIHIKIITESAWHAAFSRNMFITEVKNFSQEPFVILHAPNMQIDANKSGINSSAFIVLHLAERVILIGGVQYAGEIKKAVFSAMNYYLPLKGILPMHAAANVYADNAVVFFGLSGTGKTTLSADIDRHLVGDDEHGWSNNGIFNFENGCYAKLANLSKKYETAIWNAVNRFGSILENIVIDEKLFPDFNDISLTKNTRGSYPISHMANIKEDGKCLHPKNIIFLTCDAFGVLPLVSRLTLPQVAYHFISGYTTKTVETEIGLFEPKSSFSACYGAACMPLHPVVYADLLCKKIEEHNVNCWLLNTGWVGGPLGVGSRISISLTRSILTAILENKLNDVGYVTDLRFGLEVPISCPDVPSKLLNIKKTWFDQEAYNLQANLLSHMFNKNFEKYAAFCKKAVCMVAPKIDHV